MNRSRILCVHDIQPHDANASIAWCSVCRAELSCSNAKCPGPSHLCNSCRVGLSPLPSCIRRPHHSTNFAACFKCILCAGKIWCVPNTECREEGHHICAGCDQIHNTVPSYDDFVSHDLYPIQMTPLFERIYLHVATCPALARTGMKIPREDENGIRY